MPSVRAFDELVADLDYPMLIVTARGSDGERAGCLVGFATQCSIDPARFLVCISDKNRTYRVAKDADTLVVHFVPDNRTELVELFGGHTGDEEDKFARCAWRDGPGGAPVLDACPNWFSGAVRGRLPLGDHVGFLLEPVAAERGIAQQDFTFHRARRIEPGHEA